MSVTAIVVVSVLVFMLLMFLGLPVWSVLLGVGLIFLLIWQGPTSLYIALASAADSLVSENYIAIPAFVLMAVILQHSGVASDLYEVMYKWFGALRGGLAIGTIAMCVIIAGMTGLGGTGVLTMGLLGLPEMMKRGYHRDIALGCIPAGGALGPIIPPSIILIVLGGYTAVPVGPLFMGSILPGLLIAGLWIAYIGARCYYRPGLAPALSKSERASWSEKFKSLRGVILPIFLILAVLGGLYKGIWTPSEAGATGAFGAFIVALIKRRGNWATVSISLSSAIRITAMVMWCLIAAKTFSHFLTTSGIADSIATMLSGLPIGTLGIIAVMCVIAIMLGMFIELIPIIMITIPVFMPVLIGLKVDLIWFLVVYNVALCTGYISPPFGMNLFYTRGILPKDSKLGMGDIYHSSWPFFAVMVSSLVILLLVPGIATFIPNLMKG